jgi:hypothetical protein
MSEFNPGLYTQEYNESKNVLALCFHKYCTTIIDPYLREYNLGYATFEDKRYFINNKFVHYCSGISGHPFELIIKFLSIYGKNSNSQKFNDILTDIYNTPKKQYINLSECLMFFSNNNYIMDELKQPTDFFELFILIINNSYAGIIGMINKLYTSIKNRKYSRKTLSIVRPTYNIDNLSDYIIAQSNYIKNCSVNVDNTFYSKELIINSKIILIKIERVTIDLITGEIDFLNDKFCIPKILDLPFFCFYKNEKFNYELIGVIIYDITRRKYSIIIKQDNDFFHYLSDKIIKVDDAYFNDVIYHYAYGIIYKQIS